MTRYITREQLESKISKINKKMDIGLKLVKIENRIGVEATDKELNTKTLFVGDIRECGVFIEGFISAIEIGGVDKK